MNRLSPRRAGLLGAALLLSASTSACIQLHSATRETVLQVQAPAASAPLVVETQNGAVAVEIDPSRSTIEVAATIRIRRARESDARDRAQATEVRAAFEGGALRVRPAFPGGYENGDGCTFRIVAPALASVDVATDNGEITLTRTNGPATVETSNGDVTLREHAGPMEVETSNGTVRLVGVRGPANVETSNGGITFSSLHHQDEPLRFESSNGSIELQLDGGAAGRLDCETSNGRITVSGAAVRIEEQSRSRMVLEFGDGPLSTISTSNGDVQIRVGGAGQAR